MTVGAVAVVAVGAAYAAVAVDSAGVDVADVAGVVDAGVVDVGLEDAVADGDDVVSVVGALGSVDAAAGAAAFPDGSHFSS